MNMSSKGLEAMRLQGRGGSQARGSGQTHWFKGKASGPGSVMLQGHLQETWVPWARTFWEKIRVQKKDEH